MEKVTELSSWAGGQRAEGSQVGEAGRQGQAGAGRAYSAAIPLKLLTDMHWRHTASPWKASCQKVLPQTSHRWTNVLHDSTSMRFLEESGS